MGRFLKIDAVSGEILNIELWDMPPEDGAEVYRLSPTGGPGDFYNLGSGAVTSAPVAAVTPYAVDMRQASLKLLSEPHGGGTRLDAVDAYVATQARTVQIEWERAKELRRDHPMVGIMGFFFGMNSDDLDQWFRDAAAIGPTLAL